MNVARTRRDLLAAGERLTTIEANGSVEHRARVEESHLSAQRQLVRTTIVQRVFNESLNRLWADLFTRLAPEENFIPAFACREDLRVL
jgi:exonuclease SbcC